MQLSNLIEIPTLEDFLGGCARLTCGIVAAYDESGPRLAAAGIGADVLPTLLNIDETLPGGGAETPAWCGMAIGPRNCILVPVFTGSTRVGFVAVGEPASAVNCPDRHEELVRSARWIARVLSHWCANAARLHTATGGLELVGELGRLLAGETQLEEFLESVVRETARVMHCRYASLRLYDREMGELRIAAAYNLSRRYADRGVVLRSESPIDDRALRGELVYIEDAQTDQRIPFREEVANLGIRSGLTAGLFHRGRPVGVLRVYADRVKRFRASEESMLRAVASQAATAIDNAQRVAERLRYIENERQLALAGDVQNRMMSVAIPPHSSVQAAMLFEPSWHLGGDFCDMFTFRDGQLAAVVGDVVGHGAAAAMLMASTRGALRALAEDAADLGDLMTRLNRQVCRETTPAEFVSLIAIAVTADGRTLHFANAGHDPLMLRRDDDVMQPEDGGLVLGIREQETYQQYSLRIRPGDFILLYTDGIVEANNFRGELLGRRRLSKLVRRYGKLAPQQALKNMHWDVRRFVGLAEQADDQTMIGLRVGEP